MRSWAHVLDEHPANGTANANRARGAALIAGASTRITEQAIEFRLELEISRRPVPD
jgi:hypothetical protein